MKQLLFWIRDHKASTAGLVLVVAGCLALVMLARRVHHLRPRSGPSASVAVSTSAAGTAAASDAADPAPSGQPRTEHGLRSDRMRSEFEAAPRYLAFIQQAMSRPQEGGKFYALLAWKRCSGLGPTGEVSSPHSGSDAFRDEALARVQDIEKRCVGVQQKWPDVQALYQVATQQRGGRDVLLPENGRGIVAPSTRESAGADIDAALKTGDRWAIAEALRDNAAFLDVGNSAGDDGIDRQLHEWGAAIVGCELVGDCRGGAAVSLHCVATGDCAHDDERDVVLAQVPEPQRMVFDTVLQGLHQRVGLAPGVAGAP